MRAPWPIFGVQGDQCIGAAEGVQSILMGGQNRDELGQEVLVVLDILLAKVVKVQLVTPGI